MPPLDVTATVADDDGPSGLLAVGVSYGDVWFDPAVDLLWNPAGSFAPTVRDASVHLTAQSAWYAFGLLERNQPGDVDRALAVIDAVVATQYDQPSAPWHGTFARVLEQPHPRGDARPWVDYDPNWRQFVGTTLVMVLRHHGERLGQVRRARVEASLALAVSGEPAGRITPAYSNIALLHALLAAESGWLLGNEDAVAAGEQLAAAVVARFDRTGTFDEFNSPTYYGIDLLALAMWRTTPASERLRGWGERLERDLWGDVAMFFHAGLGNLVGPFTRTYGMDMGRYLAAVGLWWWVALGRAHAPLPPLDTVSVTHGHDLLCAPLVARLGTKVPSHLREFLMGFDGVRQVERPVGDGAGEVATAWMEPEFALGGLEQPAPTSGGPAPRAASGQYAPATVHWALPAPDGLPGPRGGGRAPWTSQPVGTIRMMCDDPTGARATDGVLRIVTTPVGGDAGNDAVFLVSTGGVAVLEPSMVGPGGWNLPGLAVRVQTESTLVGAERLGDDLKVTYRASVAGHRIVLRKVADA